jgi:hypothetical protein
MKTKVETKLIGLYANLTDKEYSLFKYYANLEGKKGTEVITDLVKRFVREAAEHYELPTAQS